MASTSSRQHSRRIEERRNHCRREIEYAFGSEKWIQVLKSSYLLWPKIDRREQERRDLSRRNLERRVRLQTYRRPQHRSLQDHIEIHGLTADEKNMIEALTRKQQIELFK
jgi:hypothetical protein